MSAELLNAKECCQRFGIGHSTWAKRKKRGWTRQFEVKRPEGQKRYAKVLVEQFIKGESTVQIGRMR